MTSTITAKTTLKDLVGTGRGLGSLTVEQIRDLVGQVEPETPAKAKPKGKKAKKARAQRKPSRFYEEVIVGKREERALRQKVNHQAAAWMREKGLVPSGQAWEAVKKGERSIPKLRSLNETDGLAPLVKKASATKAVTKGAKNARKVAEKVAEHEEATESDVEREVAILVAGGFSEDEARVILG